MKEERIQKLWQLYKEIEKTLDDHEDAIQRIRNAQEVSISDTLQFAERIAPSAFAPLGWVEGLPLLNAFPPAPQADQMRIGRLAEYNRMIERKITDKEIIPIRSKVVESNDLQQILIEEAKISITSLKERLKIRQELQQAKEKSFLESKMDIVEEEPLLPEKESASPLPLIEPEPERETYIPVNTRKINISFAPVEESESEEEEEGEED